ncbi:MAG: EFR1 family ferrodoxin [Oscillospiraceae bacterium]|jgi:ferredoxin|nr:EFR1 family ferrodoxin [Oscillospiraceae bacterium]
MEKNVIFWFSGTGNSLKAAKDIAAVLGDTELVNMAAKPDQFFCQAFLSRKAERIGFVYPCYAGGIPKAVVRFVEQLNLNSDSAGYVFQLVTCNENGGNCGVQMKRLLATKAVDLSYSKWVSTVGNYIVLYQLEKHIDESLRAADEKTRAIAADIQVKKSGEIRGPVLPLRAFFGVFYAIGNHYMNTKPRQFTVTDDCTGCGLCAKLCPAGNIAMREGSPTFEHSACAQCMACIQWCPRQAVNCGTKTARRTHYHHPEIQAGELFHTKNATQGARV